MFRAYHKFEYLEQVGIIGRTGAGKSSLIQMLFRMAEHTGNIYIDGIDTKQIALNELRKCMSIIPQVCYLHDGHVRHVIRMVCSLPRTQCFLVVPCDITLTRLKSTRTQLYGVHWNRLVINTPKWICFAVKFMHFKTMVSLLDTVH